MIRYWQLCGSGIVRECSWMGSDKCPWVDFLSQDMTFEGLGLSHLWPTSFKFHQGGHYSHQVQELVVLPLHRISLLINYDLNCLLKIAFPIYILCEIWGTFSYIIWKYFTFIGLPVWFSKMRFEKRSTLACLEGDQMLSIDHLVWDHRKISCA